MLIQVMGFRYQVFTKIVHFATYLRQGTLFYDPDSFPFAYMIKYFFKTNIIELPFFGGGRELLIPQN